MKFKRATFKNFKLLRDVSIEFSNDQKRPLTVIRAENGHGKTSTLIALQWGLYGEIGLDDARKIRLSPVDWPNGEQCEIEVRIDFTHTVEDEVGGEFASKETTYQIIRSVGETPQGKESFVREAETVHLYELTDAGAEEVRGPQIKIGEMLPIEMKNVFFTDGDKAMSFISPSLTKRTKRHQVREAIRSLLGVEVLDSALDHVRKASKKFDKEIAQATGSAEAENTFAQLEEIRAQLKTHTDRVAALEIQIENLQKQQDETERRLLQALKDIGDPQELARKLKGTKEDLKSAEITEQDLKKRHQEILASEELSWKLMGAQLQRGVAELSELADRGVIPSASIPVLQDRLDFGKCICGAVLSEGTNARQTVEDLMVAQRSVDEEKESLTALYHRAKLALQGHESAVEGGRGWDKQYEELSRTRLANKKVLEGMNREEKLLQEQIDSLDEHAITQLTAHRDSIRADKSRKEDDRNNEELSRRQLEERVAVLEVAWAKIKKASTKQVDLQRNVDVTQDLCSVIGNTLDRLQKEYLGKVSSRMNDLFLQMVGADPESAGGVFRRAEITQGYDIRVLGAEDRVLDPDHELNGASKRALTIAFIWALTEVSGVIAPRLIDTPLGMMSGGVKRRVVEIVSDPVKALGGYSGDLKQEAIREFQVVLFLTRQEILKVEDLIDEQAGLVLTFTNTAFYPADVVNDPGIDLPTIRVCGCNHRQKCTTCAQRHDDKYDLSLRPN